MARSRGMPPRWGGIWSTYVKGAAAWLAERGYSAAKIAADLIRDYFYGPRSATEHLTQRALQQAATQAARMRGLLNGLQSGPMTGQIPRTNIARGDPNQTSPYYATAVVAMINDDGEVFWRPVEMEFSNNPTKEDIWAAAEAVARSVYTRRGGSPPPWKGSARWTLADVVIVSLFRRT